MFALSILLKKAHILQMVMFVKQPEMNGRRGFEGELTP